ncbi:hypothetical protein P8918_12990 [Bacillus spizizenii]|nr:hypothetical protein [Bacillus spizizenii]MCY8890486.1 hypothetical protein [Bacillus spizizenii]MEC0841941.1 hypothetical protein [Bacillus spizizenii]
MAIQKDDYIEGTEHYGPASGTRKTKGWVDYIRNDGEHFFYHIQADDGWNGARGTILTTELGKVRKLEPRGRPKRNLAKGEF